MLEICTNVKIAMYRNQEGESPICRLATANENAVKMAV